MAFALKDNTLELWTDPGTSRFHTRRFNYQMIQGGLGRARIQCAELEEDQYFNIDYFRQTGWVTFATLGNQIVPEYCSDYGALVEQCRPLAQNVLEMLRRFQP